MSIRINTAGGIADFVVFFFFLIKLSLIFEEHQVTIESGVTNYFSSIYFQRSSDISNYFIALNNTCVAFVVVFVVVFVATVVMS